MTGQLEISSVRNLLNKTTILIRKNEDFVRIKQETFNIFSILRKDHDEMNLHSAFISELLNPVGSHGQGNIFCRLFMDAAGIPKVTFEITENITVQTERDLGEYGRADTFIENGKNNF